jgi:hypothetical protein
MQSDNSIHSCEVLKETIDKLEIAGRWFSFGTQKQFRANTGAIVNWTW